MSAEQPLPVRDSGRVLNHAPLLAILYLSSDEDQLEDTARLAEEWGASLELPQFVWPATLDDADRFANAIHNSIGLSRRLTRPPGLHGPFFDLVPGSLDPSIQGVSRSRCLRALIAAREVDAAYAVFHSGYNPLLRGPGQLERWIERVVRFWTDVLDSSPYEGAVIIENVWEETPTPLLSLIEGLGRPNVLACLDTGHLNVFAREPPASWLAALAGHLGLLHLNDNQGRWDEEAALGMGTFDFDGFFSDMRRLGISPVRATLESFAPTLQRASHEWLRARSYV